MSSITSFVSNTYFRLKEHLPKPLSDNLTMAEGYIIEKKHKFDIQAEEQIDRMVDATERIIGTVLPSDSDEESESSNSAGTAFERLQKLRGTVTNRIKRLATKAIDEIKAQESVQRATEYANKFKTSIQEFMNPFEDFNKQIIDKLNVTCKAASDLYRSYFVDPVRHLAIHYLTLVDELAQKSSFNEYYVLLKEDGDMKLKLVNVSKKVGEDLQTKMKPYVDHYGNMISESLKIFVDEDGKFTLKEFEKLSKEKIDELKEKYTVAALEDLLLEKYRENKDKIPFVPEEEELKKYYNQVLELFTDENGKFTIAKVQTKIGEQADEYVVKATHTLVESKDHFVNQTAEKKPNTFLSLILTFSYACFMIYCYVVIFFFALVCYGASHLEDYWAQKKAAPVQTKKIETVESHVTVEEVPTEETTEEAPTEEETTEEVPTEETTEEAPTEEETTEEAPTEETTPVVEEI